MRRESGASFTTLFKLQPLQPSPTHVVLPPLPVFPLCSIFLRTTLTLRRILHIYCLLTQLECQLQEGRHLWLVFLFPFLHLVFRIAPAHSGP